MANVEEYVGNQVDWIKEGSTKEPQYNPILVKRVFLKGSSIEMTGAN